MPSGSANADGGLRRFLLQLDSPKVATRVHERLEPHVGNLEAGDPIDADAFGAEKSDTRPAR